MKKILSLTLLSALLCVPAQAQYTWTIADCAYQRYLCEEQGGLSCPGGGTGASVWVRYRACGEDFPACSEQELNNSQLPCDATGCIRHDFGCHAGQTYPGYIKYFCNTCNQTTWEWLWECKNCTGSGCPPL
jgi:hypothetical protein